MDQPRGATRGSRLPEVTKRTILMLKQQHPEWGCQRISDLLVRGPALPASAAAGETALECMLGEKTIAEACRELAICESRYHVLRNAWLPESLELLEPRRTRRPGKQLSIEELVRRVAQLESENHQVHEQPHQSQVQLEVARIQAALPRPPKKTRRRPRHSPR
jgi:hypothetical protein